MLMVYLLGFFMSMLPYIYQNYMRGAMKDEREAMQALSLPNGFKYIC